MSAPKKNLAWWRSLDERLDTPEFRKFVTTEFPSQAEKVADGVSRRNFLKVMGASMALAGMAACSRWPEEEIVPRAKRPEDTVPGVPKHYASSFEVGGVGFPVVVKSYDGRPIKVDGNPDHPMSMGKSDQVTQASVLELYDPDRSRAPTHEGAPATWAAFEEFLAGHRKKLEKDGGAGFRVLSEAVGSPTLARLRKKLLEKFPKAGWIEYEPFPRASEAEGLTAATGRALRAVPNLAEADLIVSFDDDLLQMHPMGVRNSYDFAQGRRAENGKMNRLVVIESTLTTTGCAADHRTAMKPSDVRSSVLALAREILPRLEGVPLDRPAWMKQLAAELEKSRGRCLICAGPSLPPEAHALVFALNEALGNVGRTVRYIDDPRRVPPRRFDVPLATDVKKGRCDTLLILGGNPGYDGSPLFSFLHTVRDVETSIHLSLFADETSDACTWHLNRAHWLESWGDSTSFDGTPGVVQPMILPLHGGRSAIEVVAALLGEKKTGQALVQETWKDLLGEAGFSKKWRKALHDGFWAEAPAADVSAKLTGSSLFGKWADGILKSVRGGEDFEIDVRPHPNLHDGRFTNNAWLMEAPSPVTRLSWDNAALLSPKDATSLKVKDGDHVKISLGALPVTIPALVLPGQAKGCVTLHAGYGRTKGGRIANGAGVNVFPVRIGGHEQFRVEKASGHTKLATTQNHHAIDAIGREAVEERMHDLIRQATLAEYERDPEFAKHAVHHPPLLSLWKEKDYTGRKWGMVIDLSSCTGCSACVTACQSENNVPVVGKEEVLKGREMLWLRVDRYYGGEPDHPEVSHQPIPCMQCENAPCEQVCPVAATVHSDEGLNDMVYNRCVGTRYCSNNCPYKVRRFNWFSNTEGLTDLRKMVMNPEVTVRSRGVMEKCTYCVQRISAARITAKNEGRKIRDGEVVTACAQACPSDAIVFGDLNDPDSRVRKLAASDRCYGLLEELNVKPRTKYLARLKNPMEIRR